MPDQRILRVGTAIDAHRLVTGRALVLGGVELAADRGLEGHSDADIVCHALCDASLGAAGGGDIGRMFPGTPTWKDARSIELLRLVWQRLSRDGWRLVNADCMVILQSPRIAPYVDEMRRVVAAAITTSPERISIRGTTTDGLGFTGRREGAAAQAVVLIERDAPAD
jgi:2-C-methyl-D-erythritol 2,4-cyclodiphosphate synthase